MTAIIKKQTKSAAGIGMPRAKVSEAGKQAASGRMPERVNQKIALTVQTGRKAKPKSAAFEAIHSAAAGLLKVGAIDQVTMRNFDKICLSETVIAAADIKRIREANKLSQPVFAKYLGTSESTVKQWETGAKHPSGMARTLLNVVKKHGIDFLA